MRTEDSARTREQLASTLAAVEQGGVIDFTTGLVSTLNPSCQPFTIHFYSPDIVYDYINFNKRTNPTR
jgi:hypothetical protein